MASINRVTLVGNLTRDPELRTTPNGKSVCTLGLAVNDRYKNDAGEWVEKPNYFDIVVWGAQAESCGQYLSKGRQIAVDGRLSYPQLGSPGRLQALQGRGHRQHGAVPGLAPGRGVRRRGRAGSDRRSLGPVSPTLRISIASFGRNVQATTTSRFNQTNQN